MIRVRRPVLELDPVDVFGLVLLEPGRDLAGQRATAQFGGVELDALFGPVESLGAFVDGRGQPAELFGQDFRQSERGAARAH